MRLKYCLNCFNIVGTSHFCNNRCEHDFYVKLEKLQPKNIVMYLEVLEFPNEHKIKYDLAKKCIDVTQSDYVKNLSFTDKYRMFNNDIRKFLYLRFNLLIKDKKNIDVSKFKVFQRDGFRCRYCGTTPYDGDKLTIDHVFPLSKGGTNHLFNIMTSCEKCNLSKARNVLPMNMVLQFWELNYRLNSKAFDKYEYNTIYEHFCNQKRY